MMLILSPLYLAYQLAVHIKNKFYEWNIFKSQKAPLPVISVGNISFGGSEKTPLCIHLLSFLFSVGMKPALVSRGYKGAWEKHGGVLSNGQNLSGGWRESGDEPFLAAIRVPQAGVFVGRDKTASCLRAKKMDFSISILDDGFQHRRLKRDLDIVLYDPAEKIALREFPSALNRADIILIKDKDNKLAESIIKKRFPGASVFRYSVTICGLVPLEGNKLHTPDSLAGKKIIAFCGIARPERFAALLREKNLHPLIFLRFPDHYSYPSSAIKKIFDHYQKSAADAVITTEKDALKIEGLKTLQGIPVYSLQIDLDLPDDFYKTILEALRNKGTILNG